MDTRIATVSASGDTKGAVDRIVAEVRGKLGGVSPVLVTAFASTKQPLGDLVAQLAPQFPGAVVLGSTTAGEFTERGDTKSSVAVFALAGDYKVFAGIGTGLRATPERAVRMALEGLPREVPGYSHRTGLLLLDTFAGNGEEVTLIAASMLGADEPLAGGAAGDDLHMKETWVACGNRAATDAVVIAQIFSKARLGLGVCHGHLPLSSPLKVTKAVGNIVHEIEGRAAWDVWKDQAGERARERGIDVNALASEAEGGFLLRYEAGLAAGKEFKIRAPLSRDAQGAISFACGVPEGSVIRIMEGVPESQIASAREAARRARHALGSGVPAGALVFDCICRNLILDQGFAKAVQGISEELGGAPIAGFETYGEIALDAGDMSGFHNTTSVVLAFPK